MSRHYASGLPLLITACLGLLVGACTKATPELELMGSLGAPSFSGQMQTIVTVQDLEGTKRVEGSCDKRSQLLEVSLDGGSSYHSLSSLCPNLTNSCMQSAMFSCEMSIAKLGFQQGQLAEKGLFVRAGAAQARSSASKILVKYQPAVPGLRTSLFSGKVSGSTYKMNVRVGTRQTAAEGSSGNYQVLPRRAQ